ncbi:hypothetical protein M0R45_026482 [Rubus argutus]|uniref:CHY-type domain-containing protein n=1 Tax=Rubus argutus TaxID=59490 RepID=A0AAW1WZC8_RUBAR
MATPGMRNLQIPNFMSKVTSDPTSINESSIEVIDGIMSSKVCAEPNKSELLALVFLGLHELGVCNFSSPREEFSEFLVVHMVRQILHSNPRPENVRSESKFIENIVDAISGHVNKAKYPVHEEKSPKQNVAELLGVGKMHYGCKHYRSRCKIRAPCCNKIYSCR